MPRRRRDRRKAATWLEKRARRLVAIVAVAALTGIGVRLAGNPIAEGLTPAAPTQHPAADQRATADRRPADAASARPAATLLAQATRPVVEPSPPRPERDASVEVMTPPPPKPAPATAPGGDRMQDMERLLAEMRRELERRDAIISNLLGRVEDLERQVALQPEDEAEEEQVPPPPAPPDEQVAPAEETPPAAPGQFEVDEETVDRALERALVETGALLLAPGAAELEPSLTYARTENELPVVIVQNGAPGEFTRTVRRNEVTTELGLRLGLPYDSQLELSFPYGYEEVERLFGSSETNDSAWGYGDLRVGLAKTLLREDGWWPDLIGRVQWDSDTGQTDDDIVLGSGFHELSGFLTGVKRQDPLAFVGTLGYETTFEKDGVDPGGELMASFGTVLAASPETSLRFFLQQSFINEAEVGGRSVPGTDGVEATFVVGASSVIAPRTLLDVAAGIGVTDDGTDYMLTVSLPIRFNLGGLLAGF